VTSAAIDRSSSLARRPRSRTSARERPGELDTNARLAVKGVFDCQAAGSSWSRTIHVTWWEPSSYRRRPQQVIQNLVRTMGCNLIARGGNGSLAGTTEIQPPSLQGALGQIGWPSPWRIVVGWLPTWPDQDQAMRLRQPDPSTAVDLDSLR